MACVNIASGIQKKVFYKKEDVCWGDLPSLATGGKTVRRVTTSFNLNKETYQSAELRTDYQMQDFRHGVRGVEGTLNGELSPTSYADFIQSALHRDFTAGVTSASVSVVTTATAPQVTRSTGSWLTDGYKIGDIVRFTGYAAAANNDKNFLIVALTATAMSVIALDGSAVVAAPTATVGVAVVGKKTFIPETGHTDDSYTVEEFYADIGQSEVFTGNKVNTIGLQLPASGLTTIDIGFMGKDLKQTGTTQYFTSPTAQASTGIFASVNGALIIDGAVVALVTSLSININNNISGDAVVGSNSKPDLYLGRCLVDGECSYYFIDGALRDKFKDEVEASLVVALTTSNAKNADAISIVLPRIKLNGSSKSDGEQGIVVSAPFQALKNAVGGAGTATEKTTIVIQDTTLV